MGWHCGRRVKLKQNKDAEAIRLKILDQVREYCETAFGISPEFVPGESKVPYAGRVFDAEEVVNLVDSSLEFWLTYGRFSQKFEKQFAAYLGLKRCLLVNSGSSANLLAFMALTSDLLGERRIEKADEVITVAAGFPTTVSPIIQYGAVPVFIDVKLETANVDPSLLEQAVGPRSKAVMLAHTLGNPFDAKAVKEFCAKHDLWFIEDNCDALGSRFEGQLTGTFGDIGTSSFYPPHHMTMGEGGALYTDDNQLYQVVLSLRDWGRDCKCPSGVDNFCGHRFEHEFSALPKGYDHKYVYSHFGYNLKVTDMQAAIGCAQLEKLPDFIEARKRNWQYLRDGLDHLSSRFILPEPTPGSDPSWFGFLLTVTEDSGFNREQLVQHLEESGIQTRMLFGGNLLRQPCFDKMRDAGTGFRVVGELANTDRFMNDAFWIGVYPGMTRSMLDYMISSITEFIRAL